MTFLVRNILLMFLIVALLTIAAASYLSGRTFYEVMLDRVFAERVALVEALGSNLSADPSAAERTLRSLYGERDLRSVRVVDTATRRILASLDVSEAGRAVDRPLPPLEADHARVSVSNIKEATVIDIAYLGSSGLVLWMTLDASYFLSPAVAFAIEQALILSALIGILGLVFYLIARRYFMRPLRLLKQAATRENPQASEPSNLGGLLESFARVADEIGRTLERDRLISQMKSDFISTTAHQLRTPLSGINWALGALLSDGDKLSAEQRSLIERALEKDRELIALVGTLLNAASIEEGKFGYRREPVSLKTEIEKTIEEEKPVADKQKIRLTFAVSGEHFPEVNVDRERIRWVIRNLIENALRYSDENTEIMVSLTQDPKQLQVSVKDQGIGIPERDRQHIFERFFRGDVAQRRRNDGSGLGLFIAKNIVNYHGGRIWFESGEGKGTTFYFTLPLSRSAAKPADLTPKRAV